MHAAPRPRWPVPASIPVRSVGRLILGRVTGRLAVFVLILGHGNGIAAVQPAAEIDIGAALGAERPVVVVARLAADRAFARTFTGAGIGAALPHIALGPR